MALAALRDKPAGTLRLTCSDNAADTVILPKLPEFLAAHSLIKVEIAVDHGLTDIVAAGSD